MKSNIERRLDIWGTEKRDAMLVITSFFPLKQRPTQMK